MASIRIFVTQDKAQHRVKTKFLGKQIFTASLDRKSREVTLTPSFFSLFSSG